MELLVLGVVVLFIVIATVKFKMHPIFSLTIAAIASGFFLGMAPKSIMSTMVEGFGNTLSGIGLVIAFGTVIGIYLEKTGSTQVLANSILGIIGLKRSPLAMNLAGFVISIPVYCVGHRVIFRSRVCATDTRTFGRCRHFGCGFGNGADIRAFGRNTSIHCRLFLGEVHRKIIAGR